MHRPTPMGVRGAIGVFAGALVLTASGFAAPGLAAHAAATGPVSPTPAAGTPQLAPNGTTVRVRQLVECGGMMYAVGSFTSVEWGGSTYTRDNVFSFSATAPYTLSSWNPVVNGVVNSIAFTNGHGCSYAYLGGQFTSVHGTAVKNIVEVSTSTGAVVSSFGHTANGQVETLLGYKSHLLAGGMFTDINGDSRYRYMSLSPTTGKDDDFLKLRVSGDVPNGSAKVYNQQLSHSGNLLLVEGDFTSVGGLPRQQIFMLNLATDPAKVTGWTSTEFNQHCIAKESDYVRAAAWSPDDSTVYVADTGDHLINWQQGTFPLSGLCDAAAAFPATQHAVRHTWVEYTGCDSYYSVAADDGAVYVAGHQRWADNPDGCNHAGPGAIADYGLQGLHPSNGTVETSGGTPVYTMARANAEDMMITRAGLWIASSTRFGSDSCGGVSGHAGICFLPYS